MIATLHLTLSFLFNSYRPELQTGCALKMIWNGEELVERKTLWEQGRFCSECRSCLFLEIFQVDFCVRLNHMTSDACFFTVAQKCLRFVSKVYILLHLISGRICVRAFTSENSDQTTHIHTSLSLSFLSLLVGFHYPIHKELLYSNFF